MATPIQEPLINTTPLPVRIVAWVFKIAGFLFAFMALFPLIGLLIGWQPEAGLPSNIVTFLILSGFATVLYVTGLLLARRSRFGALLALALTLYPFAWIVVGARTIGIADVIVTPITLVVLAFIWPHLSWRFPRSSNGNSLPPRPAV